MELFWSLKKVEKQLFWSSFWAAVDHKIMKGCTQGCSWQFCLCCASPSLPWTGQSAMQGSKHYSVSNQRVFCLKQALLECRQNGQTQRAQDLDRVWVRSHPLHMLIEWSKIRRGTALLISVGPAWRSKLARKILLQSWYRAVVTTRLESTEHFSFLCEAFLTRIWNGRRGDRCSIMHKSSESISRVTWEGQEGARTTPKDARTSPLNTPNPWHFTPSFLDVQQYRFRKPSLKLFWPWQWYTLHGVATSLGPYLVLRGRWWGLWGCFCAQHLCNQESLIKMKMDGHRRTFMIHVRVATESKSSRATTRARSAKSFKIISRNQGTTTGFNLTVDPWLRGCTTSTYREPWQIIPTIHTDSSGAQGTNSVRSHPVASNELVLSCSHCNRSSRPTFALCSAPSGGDCEYVPNWWVAPKRDRKKENKAVQEKTSSVAWAQTRDDGQRSRIVLPWT